MHSDINEIVQRITNIILLAEQNDQINYGTSELLTNDLMIAIENLDLLHLERRMKTLKACLGELNVLNNQVSPNLYLKLIEEKADLENLIDDIRNKQALRKIHD